MKTVATDISRASILQILGSSALLLMLMNGATLLLNKAFTDNLFRDLWTQAMWLFLVSTVFFTLSSVNISTANTPKTFFVKPERKKFRQLSRSCLMRLALLSPFGAVFVLAVWANSGFTMLWPSPVPITCSLFIVFSIIFQRQRALMIKCDTPFKWVRRVGEPLVLIIIYLSYIGVFKHKFNLDHEDTVVLVGSLYIISMSAKRTK